MYNQVTGGTRTKVVYLDVKPAAAASATVTPAANGVATPPPPHHRPHRDVLYGDIKWVLWALRAMGCLPFARRRQRGRRRDAGGSTFRVAAAGVAYSLLAFAAAVGAIYYVTTRKEVRIIVDSATEDQGGNKFEEAVIGYLFTVHLFPIVAVVVLWYETPKIARVLNSWVDFELSYKRVSGVPLNLGLKKKAVALTVAIPILCTASVFIRHLTMVHFKLFQIIPYVFLEVLIYILGGYWYLLCEALSSSAMILANDFQQALKHIGPAGLVAEYRALWLRLSKMARDTGVANGYTFTFINLYLFVIITLSIYGLMSQISEGFGVKDIGLAITATFSVTLLFIVCDVAHQASHHVRTDFQKKLLMVELSWMNSDAQTEVNMFLRATEMSPSSISLGGLFDVDRNLFKSLLATMVTYLVVLLQFQISIPKEAAMNGDNATTTTTTTAAAATTMISMLK